METAPDRRGFWKAVSISIAAYGAALLAGLLVDYRLTGFLLLAIQMTWTLVCIGRLVQLRFAGAHKPGAEAYDNESYRFALGGSISALALLVLAVVLSQA